MYSNISNLDLALVRQEARAIRVVRQVDTPIIILIRIVLLLIIY